jgi:hypothetical protein
MSRLLLLVLTNVALLWSTPLFAEEKLAADDPDVQTLAYTKFFGFGAIDAEGHLSEGEAALKRIVKKEGGITRLFTVFDHGTLPGKCYALVGIRHLAPNSFEDVCKQLDSMKAMTVNTIVKARVIKESLPDVLSMIRTGLYSNYLTAE